MKGLAYVCVNLSTMPLIQFTRNHTDHSTDRGYQFEFFCDRCGNGFMSEFKPSAVGMAGSALRAASSIFGGILGNVGNLSSATILFILQEWLEKRPLKAGEYAVAAAFGPGFSAEFLLLQWT